MVSEWKQDWQRILIRIAAKRTARYNRHTRDAIAKEKKCRRVSQIAVRKDSLRFVVSESTVQLETLNITSKISSGSCK